MSANQTPKLFKTVKEVKAALHRNRERMGWRTPFIYATEADGGYGRIYHLSVVVEIKGKLSFEYPFKEISNWVQGGLDKKDLLAWANENLK